MHQLPWNDENITIPIENQQTEKGPLPIVQKRSGFDTASGFSI
jgi:hypothetical protein